MQIQLTFLCCANGKYQRIFARKNRNRYLLEFYCVIYSKILLESVYFLIFVVGLAFSPIVPNT